MPPVYEDLAELEKRVAKLEAGFGTLAEIVKRLAPGDGQTDA